MKGIVPLDEKSAIFRKEKGPFQWVDDMKKLLLILSIIGSTCLIEGCLWFLEKRGVNRFSLYRQKMAENFHFYHLTKEIPRDPPAVYDSLLGWRNFERRIFDGKRETINRERWRSKKEFDKTKQKIRLAVVGDSFTYGWEVDDSETYPQFLQNELGNRVEIMNFGVRGFGLDQMALVVLHILPRYQPDFVLFAGITAAMVRSCTDFQFELKKPFFSPDEGRFELIGVPVPTPWETFESHQTGTQRLIDHLLTWTTRSRFISLVGQILLQREHRECMNEKNAAIVERAWLSKKSQFLVVHLDGELPVLYSKLLSDKGIPFFNVMNEVEKVAKEMKLTPGRQSDGHPNENLNRVYARVLSRKLHPLLFPPSSAPDSKRKLSSHP